MAGPEESGKERKTGSPCVNCTGRWQAEGGCSCTDFCEELREYLQEVAPE